MTNNRTKLEQWAVELLEAVHDASDMGSACGMVDCPQCKAAALTIQRAFEDRERKLREALHDAINAPKGVVPASAEAFYDPAAITAYEAVSGVAKMRESLTLAIDLICGTHEYEPTHPVVAKIIAALGEKP